MTKSNEIDVYIYCYVNVSVVGLGIVGPTISAKIDKKWADNLIEESPNTWSLKPFEIEKEEIIKEVYNA